MNCDIYNKVYKTSSTHKNKNKVQKQAAKKISVWKVKFTEQKNWHQLT